MLWLITIALGAIFLFGTAEEWRRLIYEHGLTISTNLFGTTYYSLVGLHAFHVTLGLVMLTTVFVVGIATGVRTQSKRINALSLYWHFVDVVWIVVFTVVDASGAELKPWPLEATAIECRHRRRGHWSWRWGAP